MTNNIQMNVKGTKLFIEIDLAHNFGLSNTGKSDVIAKSNHFEQVPGRPDLFIKLHVGRSLT